ncbi:unnamed protein product [Hymenolepis diminuta]|uniref:Uncharacterized protein n=1 Tax=Hymenolepis diminuta TaxID=6216 RepID=A0A564XV11_HYMDI|nr:unnamed protein product [Hymenolepis diminuta]
MIRPPKRLRQCNRIGTEPMHVCPPKQLAPAVDECGEPEEIGLTKRVLHANETVSKEVTQNAGEDAFNYHQDLMCFKTKAPWSHLDFDLA